MKRKRSADRRSNCTTGVVLLWLVVLTGVAACGSSGGGDTPQAAGYSPGNPFAITLLSVVRYVFDISDWDNSGWAVPLGVSGHPGSSHYEDQLPFWAKVDLIPMVYTWDRVRQEAESHQIIEPTE